MQLTLPRRSTILLLGLLPVLSASAPGPLAITVAVVTWACYARAALQAGVVLTVAWKATHPAGRAA